MQPPAGRPQAPGGTTPTSPLRTPATSTSSQGLPEEGGERGQLGQGMQSPEGLQAGPHPRDKQGTGEGGGIARIQVLCRGSQVPPQTGDWEGALVSMVLPVALHLTALTSFP